MTRHRNDGVYKRCDCPRRTWPKCPHGWHFAFKWADVHHRFSLDRHLNKHIDNKTDAETEAEKIRIAIREGRFGQPAPRQEMTLRELADIYLERYVAVTHASTARAFRYAVDTICRTMVPHGASGARALGLWRLTDIVTDTIERFREVRLGETGQTGVNRNLQSLRALYNWSVRVGYLKDSPFKRNSEPVIAIAKRDETKRTRRLNADTDEETRVLGACGAHLRAIVECALETGMRRGEILSLQWWQVEGQRVERRSVVWAPKAELLLPAAKTKTKSDRRVPVSTRLRAVLEMRRFDPAGEPLRAQAYVFGNAIGQQVSDVSRAWETAVLKAHGHKPTVTKTGSLTLAARASLEAVDLHFHDLRREAGSRWLEGGVPLHIVRDWLGHTNIAQTSTYLAGTLKTQHDAMAQFEARRAAVQQGATKSKTGGRKSPQSARRADKKPNKTAVGREQPIM